MDKSFIFEHVSGSQRERLDKVTSHLYEGFLRSYPPQLPNCMAQRCTAGVNRATIAATIQISTGAVGDVATALWQRSLAAGADGLFMPSEFEPVAKSIFDFEVREDDIWVITFPKCGTTWTQEMVWLIENNLDFAAAKKTPLDGRFPFLEITSHSSKMNEMIRGKKVPLDASITKAKEFPSPRLIKSHLPMKFLPKQIWTKKPKIVYVAREVKDVMVSYFHHYRLFVGYAADLDTFCRSFMTDEIVYCPFWPHIIDFWKMRHEPNIFYLTYEEMQKDHADVVQKIAKFLNRTLNHEQVQQLCNHLSFKEMKNNESVNFNYCSDVLKEKRISRDEKCSFMRKGKAGSWKEEMSEELAKEIDRWTAKMLAGSSYVY